MTKEYIIDSEENSDYMYNYIKKVLDEVGPRASGSPEERQAAELVEKDMKDMGCDATEMEEFQLYPRAFLGWFKIVMNLWLISFVIFVFVDKSPILIPILSLAACFLGLMTLYKQFMRYEEWTPKWLPYKQKTSQNTLGIIKPTGEVTKRVVVGGHLDSAFMCNLIEHTRQGYAYCVAGALIGFALTIITYLLSLIYTIFGVTDTVIPTIISWIGLLLPFALVLFVFTVGKSEAILGGALQKVHPSAMILFAYTLVYCILIDVIFWERAFVNPSLYNASVFIFHISLPAIVGLFYYQGKDAVPGAIDNLTAVAVCMCIGKILNEWKQGYPDLVPKNTEVVIGIMGSEEAGLRGSTFFSKKHAEEYNKIDTTCINLESLAESRGQTVYTAESTTGTIMTPEVYNLVMECCKELGIKCRLGEMPSIAGGTDATGFIRGGLKATCIEGLRYKDYLSFYHTRRDNLSGINKHRKDWMDVGPNWHSRNVRGAMEMAILTVLKYIEKKDEE